MLWRIGISVNRYMMIEFFFWNAYTLLLVCCSSAHYDIIFR